MKNRIQSICEEAEFDSALDDPDTARDPHALHRLSTVRRQQGVSLRKVARALRQDIREVRVQEEETSDLPLSTLYKWQQVLEVPIADLLVDDEAPLSTPVMNRARLLRLMKTAVSIAEKADKVATQRLAQTLVSQLLEIMPELEGVSPWHAVGQRRTLDEYGQAALRRLPDRFSFDY